MFYSCSKLRAEDPKINQCSWLQRTELTMIRIKVDSIPFFWFGDQIKIHSLIMDSYPQLFESKKYNNIRAIIQIHLLFGKCHTPTSYKKIEVCGFVFVQFESTIQLVIQIRFESIRIRIQNLTMICTNCSNFFYWNTEVLDLSLENFQMSNSKFSYKKNQNKEYTIFWRFFKSRPKIVGSNEL